jgi:hypothetical protein
MANTATLADVKLVLSAPVHIQIKRSAYGKALVAFVSARTKFTDRAAVRTWTDTVEAARRLHAEAKRAELEREAAASTGRHRRGSGGLMARRGDGACQRRMTALGAALEALIRAHRRACGRES